MEAYGAYPSVPALPACRLEDPFYWHKWGEVPRQVRDRSSGLGQLGLLHLCPREHQLNASCFCPGKSSIPLPARELSHFPGFIDYTAKTEPLFSFSVALAQARGLP